MVTDKRLVKRMWEIIYNIAEIDINGYLNYDPKNIAEHLNDYFVNILLLVLSATVHWIKKIAIITQIRQIGNSFSTQFLKLIF